MKKREIEQKNIAMKDVQGLPPVDVKRVRPRERLLDFRGRIQGREGSDRFGHVDGWVTLASEGIEPLKSALPFGLASIAKNGGIVGQPLELWDFRHTGAFFAEDPFRSERRPLRLSQRGERCKEQHNQGREKKSSCTEVFGRHKVFFSWPERVQVDARLLIIDDERDPGKIIKAFEKRDPPIVHCPFGCNVLHFGPVGYAAALE